MIMFRHKSLPAETPSQPATEAGSPNIVADPVLKEKKFVPESTPGDLRELVEKNLKWSQIIYEQNRKINNKLLWAAIFSWFKLIIIVGPIIWAIIYLQPMLKGVWSQYNELLGGVTAVNKGALGQGSLESLFKLFNLDPAKQEQLKALLK